MRVKQCRYNCNITDARPKCCADGPRAHLVVGRRDPIEHLEPVQGSLASLGLVRQHACGWRDSRLAPRGSRGPRTPRGTLSASDGSACGVISWSGNSNTSGRSPHHWPPIHLPSSGPAHLALSAKRCGWVLGSGTGHGMGWCSCACGGRPGTSLGRERVRGLRPQPHANFFNTHIHTRKGLLGNANEHFPPLVGSLLEPTKAANPQVHPLQVFSQILTYTCSCRNCQKC